MELITIIIPVYNTGTLLSRCLDSIKNQTYSNLEILIIDDGSTDDSAQICAEYCKHDNRFRYIYQENAGVSKARNNGLSIARGNYINFCDSDDWIEAQYIEELYNGIVKTNSDIAICGYKMTDGTSVFQTVKPSELKSMTTAEFANSFWEYHDGVFINIQTNKLFKRELIKSGFKAGMTCGEDMYFNLEYMKNTERVAIVPSSGYFYYKQPTREVKYKKNDAAQCIEYSECVKGFLSQFLAESDYSNEYEAFLCGNMCRDVFSIAQSQRFREAKRHISEFIQRKEFKDALNNNAWKKLGIKYRAIALLLKMRCVALIIVVSKALKIVRRG